VISTSGARRNLAQLAVLAHASHVPASVADGREYDGYDQRDLLARKGPNGHRLVQTRVQQALLVKGPLPAKLKA